MTALGLDPNDPSRIWLGTAAGGVFLSEDAGATFSPVVDEQTALAIGSLAVSVEVTNAVNIGNTCCTELIAVEDGAGNTTFTTETSDWLPVVPSIGVLWEF